MPKCRQAVAALHPAQRQLAPMCCGSLYNTPPPMQQLVITTYVLLALIAAESILVRRSRQEAESAQLCLALVGWCCACPPKPSIWACPQSSAPATSQLGPRSDADSRGKLAQL